MHGAKPAHTYLGVPLLRPKVAFFELSSCEGCQLQILNNESTLLDFLSLVDIVNFREAMTGGGDNYEIAFVEGSITRDDEVRRLRQIREKCEILVAFGSCACFGGVNQLKNRLGAAQAKKLVYGEAPIETEEVRPLHSVVKVDIKIYGCPVRKEEVESIVMDISAGRAVSMPKYPVCMECKANENICLFDLGELCLGPITRGGCNSWCPNGRAGCMGCRGPSEDANIGQMEKIMIERGFSPEEILDRLECFGGFAAFAEELRTKTEKGNRG